MKTTKVIPYSPEEQFKALKDKAQDILPEGLFLSQLKKSFDTQTPLKIKFGADPSHPDIHLGHTIILQKLKQFQDFGHTVYFLIGDFTSQIGDPTGRNKTRPGLTKKEVMENSKTYKSQISKILDLDRTQIVFNSAWWEKMKVHDFIQILSKVTVQILSKRDDFSKRLKEEEPIFIHEFTYPILQAYDSCHLKCDIEVGGTDQTFNLLMGRDLQKIYGMSDPQIVFTLPLLEGLDGIQKMSKSLGNAIGINDEAQDMFGKIMSISDHLMVFYYKLLSQKGEKKIREILKNLKLKKLHPMEAKKDLAEEITALYHSKKKAQVERFQFEERFSKKKIPQNLKLFKTSQSSLFIPQFLTKELKWFQSNSEVRRLIQQDGLKVNQEMYKRDTLFLEKGKKYILQAGKLKIVQILKD